jgi:hypothetical protein
MKRRNFTKLLAGLPVIGAAGAVHDMVDCTAGESLPDVVGTPVDGMLYFDGTLGTWARPLSRQDMVWLHNEGSGRSYDGSAPSELLPYLNALES